MSVETYPWPAWLLKSNPYNHWIPVLKSLWWPGHPQPSTTPHAGLPTNGKATLRICVGTITTTSDPENPKPKEGSNKPWLAMEQPHFCHPGSTLKHESLSVAILQPPSCQCHGVIEDGNCLAPAENFTHSAPPGQIKQRPPIQILKIDVYAFVYV